MTKVADTVTSKLLPSKFVAVTTAAAVAGKVVPGLNVEFPTSVALPAVVTLRVMVKVLLTASRRLLISKPMRWTLERY